MNANDADDEGSGNEAEEHPAVEPDEDSSSEESAVELSDQGGSSSEDNLSQQPLATLSHSYAERARGLIPAVSDSLRTIPGLRTRLHRACRPWALFHLVVYHIYH